MSFRFLALALLAALVAVARAQSFNIDLDVGSPPEGGGGAPSTSFGAAAGQTGFWNAIDAPGPVVPVNLRDLSGLLTPVTLTSSGGIGIGMAINFPSNTGDWARLLNDFAGGASSGSSVYTFSGISPGDYIVYSYAVRPSDIGRPVHVQVTGGSEGVIDVLGPMPGNTFIPGITHSVHHVHLTGTTLNITLSSPDINSAVNGFQIVAVPEPATLLALAAGILTATRRRKLTIFKKYI